MNNETLDYEQKVEMLKYNISRFDHFYASVNFKSSFLVLGNITILGFLLTSISRINEYILYLNLPLICLSLVFVLVAIKPYLVSYNKSYSLIFFNDIVNMEYSIFKGKIDNLSQENYLNDLKKQTFILASGLKIKFSCLNLSTITFIINIIVLFINLGFII